MRFFQQASADVIGLACSAVRWLNEWFWRTLIRLLSKDDGIGDRWG